MDLTKNDYDIIMNIALKVHNIIGCSGVTRSDFKFYNGKFYLLEINTQPGMTNLSLVPEINFAYHGISFIKLIELILKDASKKSRKILLYIFLFFIIGTLNNKNFNNSNFLKINEIKVFGLDEKNNQEIVKNIKLLQLGNLFF